MTQAQVRSLPPSGLKEAEAKLDPERLPNVTVYTPPETRDPGRKTDAGLPVPAFEVRMVWSGPDPSAMDIPQAALAGAKLQLTRISLKGLT